MPLILLRQGRWQATPDGGGGKGNLCSVSSPSVAFGATPPWQGRIGMFLSGYRARF
ncbi:hypothetical protein C8J47_2802 [Sphingomonas sp. PP-F2F-G114-C0414]|nr:hypothetical protein C8J47_2802 [Sphingomonas sp. PP-F2F-G114-C0414]